MPTTKLYRVALIAVSTVYSVIVLVQNGGDLTDPNTWQRLAVPILVTIITAIRQIGDNTTPTLPSAGPVELPKP